MSQNNIGQNYLDINGYLVPLELETFMHSENLHPDALRVLCHLYPNPTDMINSFAIQDDLYQEAQGLLSAWALLPPKPPHEHYGEPR